MVTEGQDCSKGKGKVIDGGKNSYSGEAGDIVRSKTGEVALPMILAACVLHYILICFNSI
jgi:hypothetical protein